MAVTPEPGVIELSLKAAVGLLKRGSPDKAQELLARVKTAAHEQGLDDLVYAANRNLAISYQLQGRAHYAAGIRGYDDQHHFAYTTPEEGTRQRLESAAKKYAQAEQAFTEFDSSFRTQQHRELKQMYLAELFYYWESTCLTLAVDAGYRGTETIKEAAGSNTDEDRIRDRIRKGIESLDNALFWREQAAQVRHKAEASGIKVHETCAKVLEQKIAEFSDVAISAADIIEEPELAQGYLQWRQSQKNLI